MLVNQKFIADEVGCSQKTVSLYFKNRLLVAEKTRNQLDLVVQKYNYFPNAAARSIKNNRFNRIACLVAQYGSYSSASRPQLMTYLNGAALELGKHGYSLVLEQVYIDSDTHRVDFPEFFSMRSVDGIIGIPSGWTPPEIDQRVAALELPTVWLNRQSPGEGTKNILFDESAGVIELVNHLASEGIRRVAWLGPEYVKNPENHYSAQLRYESLRDELKKCGGELTVSAFIEGNQPLVDSCVDIVRQYRQFDALVCYSQQHREAVFGALIGAGIDVRKMKILHFASSWEYHPRHYDYYDFILLPEADLGRRGAEYILSHINGSANPTLLTPLVGKLHLGKGFPKA